VRSKIRIRKIQKRLVENEQTTSEMNVIAKAAYGALVRLSKLIGTEHLVAPMPEGNDKKQSAFAKIIPINAK
jgi:hypothetical protein